MSLYHIVGVFLFAGAVIEYINHRTPAIWYKISIVFLAAMLCFRYGQGTDYFGYWWIYDRISNAGSIVQSVNVDVHGEIGWKVLCAMFGALKISFPWFVFILSVAEIFLLNRFFKKFCPSRMLAVFLSYPTLYLTYCMSALRQGLVICIFLGILLDLYLKGRYKAYYIGVLLCVLLHSCAYLLLLVPIVKWMKIWSFNRIQWLVLFSWMAGFIISTGVVNPILFKILPYSITYYFQKITISVAIIERMITFIFVSISYVGDKKRDSKATDFLRELMYIYSLGMAAYGMILWMPLIASRFTYILKCLEIILLCVTLAEKSRQRNIIFIYVILLSAVMYVKNIDSYIEQGRYIENISAWNYPYVSMADKEDIFKYRDVIYTLDFD